MKLVKTVGHQKQADIDPDLADPVPCFTLDSVFPPVLSAY